MLDWQNMTETMISVSKDEESIVYESNVQSQCAYRWEPLKQNSTYMNCGEPMLGQFVQLQIRNRAIKLYEIEVHGY